MALEDKNKVLLTTARIVIRTCHKVRASADGDGAGTSIPTALLTARSICIDEPTNVPVSDEIRK
jgi:hypothetical protein